MHKTGNLTFSNIVFISYFSVYFILAFIIYFDFIYSCDPSIGPNLDDSQRIIYFSEDYAYSSIYLITIL